MNIYCNESIVFFCTGILKIVISFLKIIVKIVSYIPLIKNISVILDRHVFPIIVTIWNLSNKSNFKKQLNLVYILCKWNQCWSYFFFVFYRKTEVMKSLRKLEVHLPHICAIRNVKADTTVENIYHPLFIS